MFPGEHGARDGRRTVPTFLIEAVAPVVVDRDNGTTRRTAAIRAGKFGVAIAVERESPHEAVHGEVFGCADESVYVDRLSDVGGPPESGLNNAHIVHVPLSSTGSR